MSAPVKTSGFTVAVDGPSASGKGTLSKRIAEHFGFAYLDTGLLYRAVGLATLQGKDAIEAARTLDLSAIDEHPLRSAEVAQAASKAAAIPEVRKALLDQQRAFAQRAGGAVLDGRDIGTVICPDAPAKLFITASADARAKRRFADLQARGDETDYEEVLADIRERDARDMGRADAPLKAADDAFCLDTTDLPIDEAAKQVIAFVASKRVSQAGSILPDEPVFR